MEQRVKRNLLIAAITSSTLLLSSAYAATPTPKASPSKKASPAVSKSATAKPAASSTTKKPTKNSFLVEYFLSSPHCHLGCNNLPRYFH